MAAPVLLGCGNVQAQVVNMEVQQQAPSAVLPVVGSAPQMLAVRQPLMRVPKVVEQWEKKRLTDMDGFLEWIKTTWTLQ